MTPPSSPHNLFRRMESEALYAQLGRIIEGAPNLKTLPPGTRPGANPPLTPDQMLWLGRAEALITEVFGASVSIEFLHIREQLEEHLSWAADEIMKHLYRALAAIEMELPTPATGAFIPAGNTFDALKAVQRVFEEAKADILIVDPYLDEKILTEFALLAPSGILLRLLTDAGSHKPSLIPAITHFKKQYGNDRPLEVRGAAAKSLHDRMVAIDGRRIWTVGQSFNALAARAPTSFVEVDQETAALKMAAYEAIWQSAAPIPPQPDVTP
jgi:hypothetical protein